MPVTSVKLKWCGDKGSMHTTRSSCLLLVRKQQMILKVTKYFNSSKTDKLISRNKKAMWKCGAILYFRAGSTNNLLLTYYDN